jgi:hypothetical protein
MNLSAQEQLIIQGKLCPYCRRTPEFVDSVVIYGRSYGMVYLCQPCDAYVGVHKHTDKALGRLANAELRMWKKEAHKFFDRIWKGQLKTRTSAYKWLARELGIPSPVTHIGMFDVDNCRKVVEVSKKFLDKERCL